MILNDLKNDFNAFLKNNALWLCLVLVLLIVITLVIVLFFSIRYKKGHNQKNKININDWHIALGNKDNIISLSATLSRLTVTVKNQDLVNKDLLKTLGVSNIITMSNKVVLVIEDKATQIKNELEK